MASDVSCPSRPRIAVIGSGIAGLSAALDIAPHASVSLFEAQERLGGHARTVLAGRHGDRAVDTGFIVFNRANYPRLVRLFTELEVPIEKSDMSFGVSMNEGRFEYAMTSLDALFAQRRRIADPRFLKMLADLTRFHKRAASAVSDDEMTLDELLDKLRMGTWFRRFYLRPVTGAIWSTPEMEMGVFPARALVRFMQNHALMGVFGQHQWYTVSGGSVEYVRRVETRLRTQGVRIRTGAPVHHVARVDGKVTLRVAGAPAECFDHVVFATHPDQALGVLDRPTVAERRALAAIGFRDNHAVLHCDPALMPRRRAVWASWVYQADTVCQADGNAPERRIGITYWMNRLQNIPERDPLFITLNPARPIRDDAIYDAVTFRHPVFDGATFKAQKQLALLQGHMNTWYAGAWLANGFHEDGIVTARRVTRALIGAIATGRTNPQREMA